MSEWKNVTDESSVYGDGTMTETGEVLGICYKTDPVYQVIEPRFANGHDLKKEFRLRKIVRGEYFDGHSAFIIERKQ